MPRLGIYSGSVVVRAFENAGWTISRHKGSHTIMEKAGHEITLSVPVHKGKDVKRGTLRDLIKDAATSILCQIPLSGINDRSVGLKGKTLRLTV